MMNGFGLEKLGIWSLRNPVISTLIVALLVFAASIGLTRLQFSGENIEILRDGSVELENYDSLLSQFRDFNNDAVILMRIPNFATVEGIETFRELNFELQLDERVESILSIFSLVKYAGPEEGWQTAISTEFEDDEQVRRELTQLVTDIPSAQSLFSKELDSAVVVVYTKAEAIADDNVRDTMWGLEELAKEFETEDIKISIAGQPAIRSDLIRSIASDIVYLAPIAVLVCAILAFVLFRNFVSMFICAFPSLAAIYWFLGTAGLTGTHLNFLTNILPVLLIVVIFADTLHIYIKWRNLAQNDDVLEAFETALLEVGPACAISTITTALALISLCFSGNFGLFELGIVGALAIMGGYFGIMLGMPATVYWAVRSGFVPGSAKSKSATFFTKPAMALLAKRKTVIAAGLVLCLAGLFAHWSIDSRFRLIDYLGTQSEVSQSEGYIDQTYSGTTPLFALVDLDTSIRLAHPDNENRVYNTLDAIGDVFPKGSFYSLADFADEIKKAGGELDEKLIDQLPDYLTSRFISKDRSQVLITIFSSANLSASEMRGRLQALNAALEERELDSFVKITGYPVLSGIVAPRLMDNLRVSLLIAVFLSIATIAISARSLRFGIACLVPNLLPIVLVELLLYLLGVPLNLSITVALTVAFGIAVDDSVHMLNQYMINRKSSDKDEAIRGAIAEVTPAIFSTTIILSSGLLIMAFSSLPAMAVFSIVVIMTLVFAFLADIFQLPEYLRTLE